MSSNLRELAKRSAGWALAHSSGLYTYRNAIFILAHMRCGSTALSNIICSRDDVSGYGEAHIRYDGRGALGRLALNHRRHGGHRPGAGLLFDKVLHSHHDDGVPDSFFAARAIFMLREPEPAVRSIAKLFQGLGRRAYDSHEKAAAYYIARTEALGHLWDRFPADRRVGLTHAGLMRDPDHALGRISTQLGLAPPLVNSYVSHAASRHGGGGDPVESGKHNRIEPALLRKSRPLDELELAPGQADALRAAHANLRERLARDWADLCDTELVG